MSSDISSRSAGIDLLRAISIFLVVLSHYGLWEFKVSGTHGVVIFFMVSGYCMAYSTNGRTGKQFLLARFWRLVPTIIICASITEAFELVLPNVMPDRGQSFRDYLSNLVCLPNGNLFCDIPFRITKGVSYSYNWIDGAYWSLLVEIRFYILLWGLYYLLRFRRPAILIASLGVLSTTGLPLPFVSKSTDFFLYLPFFAFGMAYRDYTCREKGGVMLMVYSFTIFALCSYLDIRAISMDLTRDKFVTYAACFAVFLVCMTAYSGRKSKLVSYFGVISYPLYLLHQDIGLIIIELLSWLPPFASRLFAVLIAILGAMLVNQLIEKYQYSVRKFLSESCSRWLQRRDQLS